MMKKINLLFILLLLLLASCSDDFLDVTNPNSLTPDSYWQTAEQCQKTLTATYGTLQTDYWSSFEVYFMTQNYKADDMLIRHDFDAGIQLGTYTVNPTNYIVRDLWYYSYTGIFKANQCIDYFPNADVTGDEKAAINIMVGEAKFLRAYFYFNLVNYFENIPLITNVPNSTADYYNAQVSPEEIWSQIETDLYDAIAVLPASQEPGRATKGAAEALLGKAYAQQLKWSQAVSAFENVIATGEYTLESDYASLFNGTNENNSESLFEIQFSEQRPNDTYESGIIGYELWSDGYNEAWPSDWIVSQFLKDTTTSGEYSQRAWGSIAFGGNDLFSTATKFTKDETNDYAYWEKWVYQPTDMEDWWDHVVNHPVIRYADVLLMLAEAQNELGSTANAMELINQVRARAGVPAISGLSQSEIRTHLRDFERPVELSCEALRWIDLLRWEKMENGYIKQTLSNHGKPSAGNYNDAQRIYPIPQAEMETNPKVVQNQGYN